MKFKVLCGLLLLSCVPMLQAVEDPDAYKLHVTGWSYGRERKTITSSNRVTANFNLKNVSQSDIKDVLLTLSYFTPMGEKVNEKPITATVDAIKAGESRAIKMVGDFIPIFAAYGIEVKYAGSSQPELWRCSSDIGQPEPQNGETIKGVASVVILGKEGGLDRSGKFAGKVRVKNEGSVEAKNLKITVTYFDAKKNKAGEWTGTLGKGMLGAGVEQAIDFVAANAPRSLGGYELKVGCDDTSVEGSLAAIEFTKDENVEFAKFHFKRADPKSKDVQVTAQVRNGFSMAVDNVKFTLVLLGVKKKELKRFTYEHPGELKAGEIKSVDFTMPVLPNFDTFETSVDYKRIDNKPAVAAAPVAPAPAAKFDKTNDVEVIFTDVVTNEDKSVSIVGALRNGKATPVKDVCVTVTFAMSGGDPIIAERTLTDVIQHEQERKFVIKSPNTAGFQMYSFKFKYANVE
jgi:hypothetical protein